MIGYYVQKATRHADEADDLLRGWLGQRLKEKERKLLIRIMIVSIMTGHLFGAAVCAAALYEILQWALR